MPAALFLATCLVVGIGDGDSLTARCGRPGAYQQVKVRLGGIDAPEKGQPFGQRAKASLGELCYLQQARLVPRSIDRYGRTVGDVSCRDRDAARHQVRTGMAWVYDSFSRGYEGLYVLQDQARERGAGLWAERPAVPPWEWRRARRAH